METAVSDNRRNIYQPDEDWRRMKERAAAHGLSVSAYLRRLALAEAGVERPEWLHRIEDHFLGDTPEENDG
jgi:hypothetical protein